MSFSSPKSISDRLTHAYAQAGPLTKLLVKGRPYICPFHQLLDDVPDKARVLDVGCGTGVFLNLIAMTGKLQDGHGVDANAAAIAQAKTASDGLGEAAPTFEHRRVEDGLPDGVFDVVSMIDVIHHVDPAFQKQAIEDAALQVRPGGIFLYKDMRKDQPIRSSMNRLHDLVLAREWIHYVAASDIRSWVEPLGFDCERTWQTNMLWYGHEALVFRRGQTHAAEDAA